MADFIHIGSKIISKYGINHITKSIDCVNGVNSFLVTVWFQDGRSVSVEFGSLQELAETFARLIRELT